MALLRRTVRFSVNPPARRAEERDDPNGYAAIPAMRGLGRHYAIEVTCAGEPDPRTGYLLNIKDIDRAVRAAVVPRITEACDQRPDAEPGEILPALIAPLDDALRGRLAAVRWWLSPYYSAEVARSEPNVVLLRQRFDFAASHRLHVASMTAEENRAVFGKCNNPHGHGHNYQLEPCVAVRSTGARQPFTLPQLERLVEDTIIRRFDHKHLNEDTPEFSGGRGTASSVENISRVFYDLLAPAIRNASPDAELRSITVWETDRTSSTYPA